jgi:hypothetical protein
MESEDFEGKRVIESLAIELSKVGLSQLITDPP